ncbi:LptF/LptG family permease [Dictyoglomus turgidum]|uniref:LptF/LptG family permease n=1 Tax=Dictyoglomus turgidum TaxID=513050 RepID=UPI002352AB78|nr:LptF/LptG family permease [Dictyoglomus turgidum]
MKIISRYFLQNFIPVFFVGLLLFTTILLVSPLFIIMDLVVARSIPLKTALELFITKIPPYLTYTFPMAIFLAVVYVIGQFSEHGEIMAMKASGASIKYFLPAILMFSLSAQLIMFYVNEFVAPKAYEREKILMNKAYNNVIMPSRENVFFNENNSFYFFRKVDPKNKKFEDILLIELLEKGNVRLIIHAEKALWDEFKGWTFMNGEVYSLNKEGEIIFQGKFKEYKVTLNRTPYQLVPSSKPVEEMSIFEIVDQIRLLEGTGLNLNNLKTEFHIRIALPFTCPIFAILALGLGLNMGKGGRSLSFGLSVISIFVYYIIFSIGRSLAKAGIVPYFLGAWLGNIVFLIIGIYLLNKKR